MASTFVTFNAADYLIGKGTKCSSNRGNQFVKQLVLAMFDEYERADKGTDYLDEGTNKRDKFVIKAEIIEALKASGGRFLKKTKAGTWTEASPAEANKRVMEEFRNLRVLRRRLQQQQPTLIVPIVADGRSGAGSGQGIPEYSEAPASALASGLGLETEDTEPSAETHLVDSMLNSDAPQGNNCHGQYRAAQSVESNIELVTPRRECGSPSIDSCNDFGFGVPCNTATVQRAENANRNTSRLFGDSKVDDSSVLSDELSHQDLSLASSLIETPRSISDSVPCSCMSISSSCKERLMCCTLGSVSVDSGVIAPFGPVSPDMLEISTSSSEATDAIHSILKQMKDRLKADHEPTVTEMMESLVHYTNFLENDNTIVAASGVLDDDEEEDDDCGIHVIVNAMEAYPFNSRIQRNGWWALCGLTLTSNDDSRVYVSVDRGLHFYLFATRNFSPLESLQMWACFEAADNREHEQECVELAIKAAQVQFQRNQRIRRYGCYAIGGCSATPLDHQSAIVVRGNKQRSLLAPDVKRRLRHSISTTTCRFVFDGALKREFW